MKNELKIYSVTTSRYILYTVEFRYIEVDGTVTIVFKFKLPEEQIDLHVG